jgi:hypothetical protein
MSPREAFQRALEAQFAGQYQEGERDGSWVATFPAKCAEVGDVVVKEADEGVIVYVGSFTHVHYNPLYTRHGSLHKTVSECVLFLRDLFSDRVLLWRTRKGDGCLHILKAGKRASAKERPTFVWSGPLT